MHVPDGFLSPSVTLPAWAVAAPVWVHAARKHFGRSAVEALPEMGTLTALAFVVQTLMVPVPGGTSTHLSGMALLAILRGPLAAFACESLVLLVQATFLGAGGLTVLGVNALALGLLGPAAGWLAFRALRRLGDRPAAFAAGWLALQASSLGVALVLWLQHALAPGYLPVPPEVSFAAVMIPSLTVAGALEGAYTVFALSLLRKVSPGASP